MIRAAMLSLWLGGLVLATGCYETPMPACTFACSASGECPSGYSCSAVDNICKRNDVPADHMCEGLVLADASVVSPDAPVIDAAVIDSAVADAAVPDAPVPDAPLPDAPLPDAPLPDAMPVCGNGIQESGEACDDFNNNDCGSCIAGCTAVQTPTAATGSITVVAAASLVAGTDQFTIDDGFNAATTFTFNTSGSPPVIDISAATTADDVKTATINAINAIGGTLEVTASDGGTGVVTLTHDRLSSAGNQAVTESVSDAGFMVSGLSGGVAGDCPATTGCNSNDDCLSGSCGASVANQCD